MECREFFIYFFMVLLFSEDVIFLLKLIVVWVVFGGVNFIVECVVC